MRTRKYTLEPLAELREAKVDDAVRQLADAVGHRDAAEEQRRAAERRCDAHEAGAAQVRDGERGALARGELSVGDLARADAWELRVAADREALTSDVEHARTREAKARETERSAIGQVATRKADAEVIARDRARWQGVERTRAEAQEEESASEATARRDGVDGRLRSNR